MERLNEFELELLETLPVEPIGFSLADYADDLLGGHGPVDKGKVRRALERIGQVLGPLHTCRGIDGFGRSETLYGLRAAVMPRVRAFFASKALQNV
jgi:hypothetical protein